MMKRLLLTIMLFTGCISAPDGSRLLVTAENDRLDVIMAAWHAAELEPIGARCIEDRERFQILEPSTDERMFEATGYCGPPEERGGCAARVQSGECRWGCAWSAMSHYKDGVWPVAFLERSWPLLIRWAGRRSTPRTLRNAFDHEAAHWLEMCTGRGVDRAHTAGPVWGPNGLVKRIR